MARLRRVAAVKPSYLAEMVAHVLSDHPDVATVETFAEVGAVGDAWPPHGVKVTLTDGQAVWLSCNAAGTPGEIMATRPDHLTPNHLAQPVGA